MQIYLAHQTKYRLRLNCTQYKTFSLEEMAQLQNALSSLGGITKLKIYQRIGELAISYEAPMTKKAILDFLSDFHFSSVLSEEASAYLTGIELNQTYKNRLMAKTAQHLFNKFFLPMPVNMAIGLYKSLPYLKEGLKSLWQRKMDVAILDATAIGISILRRDMATASSIMYLLGVGELLEEWTHKKSVDDLAKKYGNQSRQRLAKNAKWRRSPCPTFSC